MHPNTACAFKPGCLMGLTWLHAQDYKACIENKNAVRCMSMW